MRNWLITMVLLSFPVMVQAAYFGVGTGTVTLDIDTTGADQVDDEDNHFKIFGGVEVSPNLNIEFGHINFGEFRAHFPDFDETDTATATAFTVSGLLNGDLTPNLGAYFRFGMNFWSAEYDIELSDPFFGDFSGGGDGSGNSTFMGGGLDLKLGEKASVRLEMEKYKDIAKGMSVEIEDLGSFELEGSDVDLFGVALIIQLE